MRRNIRSIRGIGRKISNKQQRTKKQRQTLKRRQTIKRRQTKKQRRMRSKVRRHNSKVRKLRGGGILQDGWQKMEDDEYKNLKREIDELDEVNLDKLFMKYYYEYQKTKELPESTMDEYNITQLNLRKFNPNKFSLPPDDEKLSEMKEKYKTESIMRAAEKCAETQEEVENDNARKLINNNQTKIKNQVFAGASSHGINNDRRERLKTEIEAANKAVEAEIKSEAAAAKAAKEAEEGIYMELASEEGEREE